MPIDTHNVTTSLSATHYASQAQDLGFDAAPSGVLDEGGPQPLHDSCHRSWQISYLSTKQKAKPRKEASPTNLRQFAKQLAEAKKLERTSWIENDVYDLVDMRKVNCRKWASGRWVLTLKRDKEGNLLKCKARWVLRGFQDKQI